MKYTLLLLISFLGVIQTFAQVDDYQDKLDSLQSVVWENQENDTIVANAYLLATESLFNHDQDSLLDLCHVILEKTKKSIRSTIDKKELRKLNAIRSGAFNNIGVYYFYKGDIEKTVDYFTQSYELDKSNGNIENAAETINNIGFVYQEYGDTDLAIKYFEEALGIHENSNNQKGISTCLNNIGLVYFKEKRYDKALAFFNQSLDLEMEIGDDEAMLINYENIAAVNRELGNLDQAYQMYEHALKLQIKNKNDNGISLSYNHLAILDLEQNRLSQAEFNGKKSLEYAKKLDSDASIKTTTSVLWKIYKAEGKWEKALETHELFMEMERKINSNALDNALLEQEIKYNFEKKEEQTTLAHEKELAILEANQKVQKIITWSIVVFTVLIILFAIIIVRKLKKAKEQKKIIEEKNAENELLLGEIHHRVKNNLQVISSLLSLQERNISDETAKAAILEGKERVQSMGLIHKLLYQENNFAGIDMNDYVQKLIDGLLDSFGVSKEEMELDINFNRINLDVDTAVPIGLMINELVINSLKYAFEGTNMPKLTVKIEEKNQQLILQVEDNGNGDLEGVLQSKSFGMKLIRSLSRQIGGVLEIEKHIGLCFKISINDYKTVN